MKVRCLRLVDHEGVALERSDWLTVGKIYHVLEIFADVRCRWLVRLLADGSNGVALFPLREFALVSNKIPASWELGWNGEVLVLRPQGWSQIGFWEEYYDRNPDAIRLFEEEFKKLVLADP